MKRCLHGFLYCFINNKFEKTNGFICTCETNKSQGAQSVMEICTCCTEFNHCTEYIIKTSKNDDIFLKEIRLINAVNAVNTIDYQNVLNSILPFAIHTDKNKIIMHKKTLLSEINTSNTSNTSNISKVIVSKVIECLLNSYIQFNKVAYHRDIKP